MSDLLSHITDADLLRAIAAEMRAAADSNSVIEDRTILLQRAERLNRIATKLETWASVVRNAGREFEKAINKSIEGR